MRTTLAALVLIVAACASAQMWIPIGAATPRPPKALDSVMMLEKEPTDREFTVIGLIVPPEGEYDSYVATINAARAEAARRGADAMFVASETDKSGWGFSGKSGGSTSSTDVRIKAIVWK